MSKNVVFGVALIVTMLAMENWLGSPPVTRADEKHDHKRSSLHIHAAPPPEYRSVIVPSGIWTNAAMLARGRAIYDVKCAVCHGVRGSGDGPAVAALPLKPPSVRDARMVAEMTAPYWFWRVSEGGAVEPYTSHGSAMPAYRNDLSVDDRWAVIAYQHSLSGHVGDHVATEHPQMMEGNVRRHPDPRGEALDSQWVRRDHRWQPGGHGSTR